MSKQKVCVVDDNDDVRRLLIRVVEKIGFDVVGAANGHAALVALQAGDTDVLVTDIVMPDVEGIELIRNVRRQFPDVRILAISGGGKIDGESYLHLAKELGADECLTKPFSCAELSATVISLAGQRVADVILD